MISIVAPMYNEEDNLSTTLNAETKELQQYGIKEFELIFVNDGSTYNTFEVAKKKRKNSLI